jgi:pyruvate/2-oxoacid:ferredoxin oxidoreductase beta subunit
VPRLRRLRHPEGLQKTLPSLGAEPHNTVFVSGIGCAARFPYYMATYGFHTIHGRAPAVATGLKVANPDLDVWLVTGDGDGLSIGGNHMLHLLRRNVDMQILLFNNEIYGLTKGQYSPTSPVGTRTPSSPLGSVDAPLHPCTFALGAGARFVARSGDTLLKHLPEVFRRAHAHKGASFVEILQNCIIYNDGAFEAVTNKKTSADNVLFAEHGSRWSSAATGPRPRRRARRLRPRRGRDRRERRHRRRHSAPRRDQRPARQRPRRPRARPTSPPSWASSTALRPRPSRRPSTTRSPPPARPPASPTPPTTSSPFSTPATPGRWTDPFSRAARVGEGARRADEGRRAERAAEGWQSIPLKLPGA